MSTAPALTTISGHESHTLEGAWSQVRFCRAPNVSGVWLLMGIRPQFYEGVMARLFAEKAVCVSSGTSLTTRLVWIAFKAPMALSARLATLFPVPTGTPALIVRSGRVLSGAAERAALKALSAADAKKVAAALTSCAPRLNKMKPETVSAIQTTSTLVFNTMRPITLAAALTNGQPGTYWVFRSLIMGGALMSWLRWTALTEQGVQFALPAHLIDR